jgi:hypothetical protein
MLAQGKNWSNARETKVGELQEKLRLEKVAPRIGKKYQD